jgi:hypothetical protein
MKRIIMLLTLAALTCSRGYAQEGVLERIAALEAKVAKIDAVSAKVDKLSSKMDAMDEQIRIMSSKMAGETGKKFAPAPGGQCSPTCSAQYGLVTGMTCGPNGCQPTYAATSAWTLDATGTYWYYDAAQNCYWYYPQTQYMQTYSTGGGCGAGGCGRGLFGRR